MKECGMCHRSRFGKCKKHYRIEREEREEQELLLISRANGFLKWAAKQDPPRTFNYAPNTLPAINGATYRYFYQGVPGVWSVDSQGNHWCDHDGLQRILTLAEEAGLLEV